MLIKNSSISTLEPLQVLRVLNGPIKTLKDLPCSMHFYPPRHRYEIETGWWEPRCFDLMASAVRTTSQCVYNMLVSSEPLAKDCQEMLMTTLSYTWTYSVKSYLCHLRGPAWLPLHRFVTYNKSRAKTPGIHSSFSCSFKHTFIEHLTKGDHHSVKCCEYKAE